MTTDGTHSAVPQPAQLAGSPPPRPRRRYRWVVVTALWAVVVGGAALSAVFFGGTTSRSQTTISSAVPTVDSAVADLVAAGDSPQAVAAIGGYGQVGDACRISLARDGRRYERDVVFFTAPGTEEALLRQIRARLPARYRAQLSNRAVQPLRADAGNYVTLLGGTVAAGQILVVLDTGCRPTGHGVVGAEPTVDLRSTPVETVFSALRVTEVRREIHTVACPGGGTAWTIEAEAPAGGVALSLADALAGTLTGVVPVLARPELYLYRTGRTGVVVRTRNGAVVVTATTGCPG